MCDRRRAARPRPPHGIGRLTRTPGWLHWKTPDSGFLPNDLVAQLDLTTLDELPASYVGRDFQRRHGDTLWRLRLHDRADQTGERTYVLVLFEFQSRIDRYMALRILTYTGLAYEALLQRGDIEGDGTLPPVLPFVVHGGAIPWSAPLDVSDL